nr:metallophosphoesterase [uncultured Desulfuromonas sp.]
MFSLVFLTVCTLLHVYLTWRLTTVFCLWQWKTRLMLWGSALIWILFSLCWLLHSQVFFLHQVSEWIWGQWIGILFIELVAVLSIDLLTLFGFLFRRAQRQLLSAALAVGVLLCILATVQGTRAPVISRYELTVEALPPALDGLSIVAVSDLHLGPILDHHWLQQRLQQIEALSPDLVVFVGDIFEMNGDQADDLIKAFNTLRVPLGLWGVSGNHEYYGKNKLALFERAGIHRLANAWQQVAPGLIIAGVDDLTVARRNGGFAHVLPDALQNRPQGATLFLSHTPWQVEQAVALGADVMISGHTHNGQIWPFNYLVQQRYPYVEGHYTLGNSHLFVGRGTGTWGPRMRLWQPAEILQLVLRSPHP